MTKLENYSVQHNNMFFCLLGCCQDTACKSIVSAQSAVHQTCRNRTEAAESEAHSGAKDWVPIAHIKSTTHA